jgi:WD40 repeat protein
MMRFTPHLRAALLWLVCALFHGCSDSTGPGIGSVTAVISTATLEPIDRDPDGYFLAIDGGPARTVEVDASVTIDSLPPGRHLLALTGMAANCTVLGENPRPLNIAAQHQPIIVNFYVSCAARTGTVHVSATTTGADLDPDGYAVTVTGVPDATILPNGTHDFSAVREGAVEVQLSGISGNCAVVGANPQTVNLELGATINAAFSIQCLQAGGIQVITTTTGAYLDPGSYSFEIKRPGDSSGIRTPISQNGTVAVSGMLGDYSLTLLNVGANCDVAETNPRALTATGGATTPVAFNITCGPPGELAFVIAYTNNDDIYVASTIGGGGHSLANDPKLDLNPAWSPDGARIAFASERDGNREIYVMNADGSRLLRLTNVSADDEEPAWSPDGTKIAFVSARDGPAEIYVMNADGSNQVRLTSGPNYYTFPAWSPDGTKIAFASSGGGTEGIWIMNVDGSGTTRLTANNSRDVAPAWSPDGTRIAFSRNRAGNSDIFLINVDGSGLIQLTHGIDNAADPSWSPDGRKIAIGAVSTSCGYYDYYNYCAPYVVIVSTSGVPYTVVAGSAFDPAWRP